MSPEREASIRSHWRYYRDMAREPLRRAQVCRVPVMQRARMWGGVTAPEPVAMPVYEFRMEYQRVNGVALRRVVCEGVEVEVEADRDG